MQDKKKWCFYSIQIRGFNTAYEKFGKSVFKEKLFHLTVFFMNKQIT